MGQPIREELDLLRKHSQNSKFIIETGTGASTAIFGEVARRAKFVTIDPVDTSSIRRRKWTLVNGRKRLMLQKPCFPKIKHVEYRNGWSVRDDDIIGPADPEFIDHPRGRGYRISDRRIALGKQKMTGEVDLIRKIIAENPNLGLDFFFCDTGEFFGYSEWRIVRDLIAPGGKMACHDIYYPKSIKCFKIARDIEGSDKWEVLAKTDSRQGLLIARRI